MHPRRGTTTTAVFVLMIWSTSPIVHELALGQCGGGAPPAKTDGKPASRCGAPALPAPAPDASATRQPLVSAGVDGIDLP